MKRPAIPPSFVGKKIQTLCCFVSIPAAFPDYLNPCHPGKKETLQNPRRSL